MGKKTTKPRLPHHCHAFNCPVQVPPKKFMCRRHWYMLPRELRDQIWSHYRPGQEVRKDPTVAYLNVARKCQEFILSLENAPVASPVSNGNEGFLF